MSPDCCPTTCQGLSGHVLLCGFPWHALSVPRIVTCCCPVCSSSSRHVSSCEPQPCLWASYHFWLIVGSEVFAKLNYIVQMWNHIALMKHLIKFSLQSGSSLVRTSSTQKQSSEENISEPLGLLAHSSVNTQRRLTYILMLPCKIVRNFVSELNQGESNSGGTCL